MLIIENTNVIVTDLKDLKKRFIRLYDVKILKGDKAEINIKLTFDHSKIKPIILKGLVYSWKYEEVKK